MRDRSCKHRSVHDRLRALCTPANDELHGRRQLRRTSRRQLNTRLSDIAGERTTPVGASGRRTSHLSPDLPTVLVDHVSDRALAYAMEVVHAPLELLQGLLGRKPIAVDLVLALARGIVIPSLDHVPPSPMTSTVVQSRIALPNSAASAGRAATTLTPAGQRGARGSREASTNASTPVGAIAPPACLREPRIHEERTLTPRTR
jgi:hypothetical protein